MEILDKTTEVCFVVDDDLLNFSLDDCEGEGEVDPTIFKGGASASSSSLEASNPKASSVRGTQTGSFPEFVEEELEWLSNKDAFPAVETCFGILSDNLELISNHQSPVSVLENNSTISTNNGSTNSSSIASCCNSLKVPTSYPVRARTKKRTRRTAGFSDLLPSRHPSGRDQVINVVKNKPDISFSLSPVPMLTDSGGGMGRRCLHCQVDKTPQWRAGPLGPKTLCNACGVRYKSGRLLPEYRPANSPTFSSVLHSNSHRKVVEMRRQKQMESGASFGYNVG